ncbi:MAG: hypothetical protein LUI14_07730 [Lachnospiraceae bacterium]|nr:hypothetical protein [Lachnospiraceae bacterium]
METTAQNRIAAPRGRRFIKAALIALLILYPFLGAFFGLDLGDTGYHLFFFTNLVSNPDKVNYTTYFTTVIGYVWDQLFGGLGLLAFNLLEVFLEWALMVIVYRNFRKLLGELTTLFGLLIAVIAADTYLNVFNYHQLNVLFLVVVLCLVNRAILSEKYWLSLLAGVAYTFLVFARLGSVVAIIICFLYIYDSLMYETSWKKTLKHLLMFAVGIGVVGAGFFLVFTATGTMQNFIDNFFRLRGLASDSTSAYSFWTLLDTLVFDNLETVASGFIFAASVGVLLCAFNIAFRHYKHKLQKVFCVLVACFIGAVAVYQMYYAWNVNPAENWPQLTTGPRFIAGVSYVIAFGCFIFYAFRKDRRSRQMTLLVLSSYLLILLTIAGSNTGTKHVMLALWLIAPVCVYTVRRLCCSGTVAEWFREFFSKIHLELHRLTIPCATVVFAVLFFAKFAHFAYYTFNYDCIDRTQLTAVVDNDKVKYIRTTEREADALEGVLDAVEEYAEDDEQPLMVFGDSLLFYYMTGRDAYAAAWLTSSSYSLAQYQADMVDAAEDYGDELPVVIYCRTNYSDGFAEESLENYQQKENALLYDGKKEYFRSFLEANGYGIVYMNDYYAVLMPIEEDDFDELRRVVNAPVYEDEE